MMVRSLYGIFCYLGIGVAWLVVYLESASISLLPDIVGSIRGSQSGS